MDPENVDVLIGAVAGAQWAVLAGAILLAVVFLFRRFVGDALQVSGWQPVIDAGMATVVAAGTALVSGAEWYRALLLALLVAGPAAGLYSELGRRILKRQG